MKYLAIALALVANLAEARQIRVGVIDSGYPMRQKKHLCPLGHRDFTGRGMRDMERHGTNIVNLIRDTAGDKADYCIVVMKFFHLEDTVNTEKTMIAALQYAKTLNLDVLNISAGGTFENAAENKALKEVLDSGTVIFASAGNDSYNLDKRCDAYPACGDPRILIVGCSNCSFSNKGKVISVWEEGFDVLAGGVRMSGTSQATAAATGKFVRFLDAYFKIKSNKVKENL